MITHTGKEDLGTSTKLSRLLIAFVLIGIVSFIWAAVALFRTDFALEENETLSDFGASSLQFGFNSQHTGAQRAPLSVERYAEKIALYPSKGLIAERPMPLFVNGHELKLSTFDGMQVLIFGSGKELLAWDVLANRIVWRVSNLPGELFSTPLLDEQFGRIYFLTSSWTGHDNPNPKQAKFTIRHSIHSIDVDGHNLHSLEVPTRELLDHEYGEITHDPRAFSMCKTAIGLNRSVTPNYIFFGCSMLTLPESDLFYGHMKGSRGLLFAFRLDDEYHVTDHGVAAFSPSEPTANPRTGFDTGIYNVGAGPILLNDGSLLVATGNGPFFPDEQNYGCSVVRVNGATLKPDIRQDGGYEYYSIEDGEFDECHGFNLDMGSSSVVTLQENGRYYAAITGKDGTVKSFDPFDLPGQERSRKHEYKLGDQMHGQPVMWRSKNGEIRINLIGRKEKFGGLKRESLISTDDARASLRNDYETLACVGLIASSPGPGRVPLNLFYSGPYKNDYVSFTDTHGDTTGRYVEKDPLPYQYQSSLGWIASDTDVQGPEGYGPEALNLNSMTSGSPYHGHRDYFNATSDVANEHLSDGVRSIEAAGYIFVDQNTGGCGTYEGEDFERIYLLSRKPIYEKRGLFAGFTINPDYTLTKRWVHSLDAGFEPHNMSPLIITPSNRDETPLMVFAIAEIGDENDRSLLVKSRLVVANAESGDIIDMIAFTGKPDSTMPLVVGDDIVLTTRDHGMIFFADGRSKFDRVNAAMWPRRLARLRKRLGRGL